MQILSSQVLSFSSTASSLPAGSLSALGSGTPDVSAEPRVVRVCDALKRNLEVYWTQRASVDAALHPGTVPAIGVNRAGGITLIVQDAVKKEALQALKVLKAVEQDRGRIYQWQGITVNLLSQAQPKEVRNHSWLA